MSPPVKIAVCYPLVNGYMAACWRELMQRPQVELFVVGFASSAGDLVDFGAEILKGVPHRLLRGGERRDPCIVPDLLSEFGPDLVLVSGWSEPGLRSVYFDRRLASARKVMLMDNQYRGDFRQKVGSVALRPLLARIDAAFVTGERAWQFARRGLRIRESAIFRGCVSVDYAGLERLLEQRRAQPWPRRFFFAGRYHERKALDVLVDGYREYRRRRSEPWSLRTAGMGPAKHLLGDVDGLEDLGFVPPSQMAKEWLTSGAFVLPSRYDAWPLVIAEAAAAGLPVVASEACGSTVELVRHLHNGYVTATGDPEALADAFCWIHDHQAELPDMGARSRGFAAAYSAQAWADRVVHIAERVGARAQR